MSQSTIVPCLVCGKELESVHDAEMQPYGGVMCNSTGNYGSTVFDAVAGDPPIMFLVCDECFVANKERIRAVRTETTRTISFIPLDQAPTQESDPPEPA